MTNSWSHKESRNSAIRAKRERSPASAWVRLSVPFLRLDCSWQKWKYLDSLAAHVGPARARAHARKDGRGRVRARATRRSISALIYVPILRTAGDPLCGFMRRAVRAKCQA